MSTKFVRSTTVAQRRFLHLDLSSDSIHRFYLTHQHVDEHRSLIVGIRELNSTEDDRHCQPTGSLRTLPKFDRPFHFTFDYGLRNYLSGCYRLDAKNQWQSDGLVVSWIIDSYDSMLRSLGGTVDKYHPHPLPVQSPVNRRLIKEKRRSFQISRSLFFVYILIVMMFRKEMNSTLDVSVRTAYFLCSRIRANKYRLKIFNGWTRSNMKSERGTETKFQKGAKEEKNQQNRETFCALIKESMRFLYLQSKSIEFFFMS